MYNEETKCIYDCSSLPPLYIDTSGSHIFCKLCHADCTLCSGTSNIQCLECKSPILLTDQHECLYTNCDNYPNTFQTDVKCEKCSEKCNECFNSPTICLACQNPYIFLAESNSCLTTCPNQFYHYIVLGECLSTIYIYIYLDCPIECLKCERTNFVDLNDLSLINFKCSQCVPNYFLSFNNSCVTGSNCGIKNFPNTDLEIPACSPCNEACDGCSGEGPENCIQCQSKYTQNALGVCKEKTCGGNEYLDENYVCQGMYKYIYIFRMPW